MNTFNTHASRFALFTALGLWLAGCGETGGGTDQADSATPTAQADDAHTHDDGTTHAGHDGEMAHDDHDHGEEVDLDPAAIDDMTVELAQSHGGIAPGKEGHLVVKLPYTDNGQTIVRAWLGTEDRTLSYVGKGEYAPSHDDYDIHAMAPDPLPENTMWWIEIEKPDGTKVVGSARPIVE